MLDCIICKENSFKTLKKDEKYSFLKCNKCGLLMIDPIPLELFDEESREDFFTDYNWVGSSKKTFDQQVSIANIMINKRIAFIDKKLKIKIDNVLEIGAGLGAWSVAFENRNIKYLGIEIDKRAVEAGKRFGANLLLGDFISDQMDITSLGKYDMIFTSQVLEHIMKPHIFFEKIGKLLNEGGILYLDVPNASGIIPLIKKIKILNLTSNKFDRDFLNLQPPWHYIAYPDKTLKYILELHNFKICYFAHYSFSNSVFGQLKTVNIKTKLINLLLDIIGSGSMTVAIAKKNK